MNLFKKLFLFFLLLFTVGLIFSPKPANATTSCKLSAGAAVSTTPACYVSTLKDSACNTMKNNAITACQNANPGKTCLANAECLLEQGTADLCNAGTTLGRYRMYATAKPYSTWTCSSNQICGATAGVCKPAVSYTCDNSHQNGTCPASNTCAYDSNLSIWGCAHNCDNNHQNGICPTGKKCTYKSDISLWQCSAPTTASCGGDAKNKPLLEVTPHNQPGNTEKSYTVVVTNKDKTGKGCTKDTFTVSKELNTELTGDFVGAKTFDLAPGAKKTLTLKVKAKAGAAKNCDKAAGCPKFVHVSVDGKKHAKVSLLSNIYTIKSANAGHPSASPTKKPTATPSKKPTATPTTAPKDKCDNNSTCKTRNVNKPICKNPASSTSICVACTASNIGACKSTQKCVNNLCVPKTQPSVSPTVSPTVTPGAGTKLKITVGTDGIGNTKRIVVKKDANGNDIGGNTNPVDPNKSLNFRVVVKSAAGNTTVYDKVQSFDYKATPQRYQATITLPADFKTGAYNLYMEGPRYLTKQYPFSINITKGVVNTADSENFYLVTGNVTNVDSSSNTIDINDYHVLVSCSVFSPDNGGACNQDANYKVYSDLNADGHVDLNDLTLWLIEVSNQEGARIPD